MTEIDQVNLFQVYESHTLFKKRKRILPMTIVTGFLVRGAPYASAFMHGKLDVLPIHT